MKSALIVVLALLWLACGGPMLVIPGGALRGDVVTEPVEDWSFLGGDGIFELETRPDDPYSVQLNYFLRDGQVYVDPAEGRRWLNYMREDPRVRGRFDGVVYPMRAVLAGEPGQLEDFDPERFVYRLESRSD